jgi:hypothetical protein
MNNSFEALDTFLREATVISFIGVFTGLTALLLGLCFQFIIKYSFFKGLSLPLIIMGVFQTYWHSKNLAEVSYTQKHAEYCFKSNPSQINSEVISILLKGKYCSVSHKNLDIALIIAGIILFTCFYRSNQVYWKGLGLGLLIISAIFLSLHLASEKHLEIYLRSFYEHC